MMNFEHPELRRYSTTMLALGATSGIKRAQGEETILRLMAMVDHFKIAEWEAGGSMPSEGEFAWEPKSPELAELISHLASPEQRIGLKAWYSMPEEMNPVATAFRDWLSARINEPLKPQQGAALNGP